MKTIIIELICLFLLLICIHPLEGQVVTKEEAGVIARNWINIVIDSYGTWGSNEKASITSIRTLEKDGRKLGYFCNVTPKGYILVSVRKELAPVKLYSETDSYTDDEFECLPDFIYNIPAKVINAIETQLAPIKSVSPVELKKIVEIDYSKSWNQVYNYVPGTYAHKTTGSSGKDGYQEGDILLTSNWRQGYPYNDDCPHGDTLCKTYNGRQLVGCVAIAGAQIMKYWNWPPFRVSEANDPYYWPNIVDTLEVPSPVGPVTGDSVDAVAELCAEVGEAIDMAYGCDESVAWLHCPTLWPQCGETSDLESKLVSEFYFHSDLEMLDRGAFDADSWFNEIKYQINAFSPIAYGIRIGLLSGGHAVVVDGWREVGNLKQYHMNFGWGGGYLKEPCWTVSGNSNTWYTLDEIPCFYDNLMLRNIKPNVAVGSNLAPFYPKKDFNYRYFDKDASGAISTFQAGQLLQTMPGVTITGNSVAKNAYVSFQGGAIPTKLYTNGDPSKGIEIKNATMRLANGGSVRLQ